jgi:AcrR family transcriptional regulator
VAETIIAEAGTRRRLLDAAAELLTRDGLDVSMEAIAARAGVTRMTLYRQLGTRDDVLVAVLLDQSVAVGRRLAEILDDTTTPFADRIVEAIVHIVMTVRSSAALTFFVESMTPTQVERLDREELFLGQVWAFLLPYFEAEGEKGNLRADPVQAVDWTLRQILLQLVVRGRSTGSAKGLSEELRLFFVPSVMAVPTRL